MRTSDVLILFLGIANLTVRALNPPSPQGKITATQLAKPLTEVQFLLLTAGCFLFSFGFLVPINYNQVQALSTGTPQYLAQYLLPILNAGSFFGRLLSGFLGDRIGRFNIFVLVCYLSGVWILALWLLETTDPGLVAFAVLFAFTSGAFVSLITPMIIQISPMAELGVSVWDSGVWDCGGWFGYQSD